jgi:glycosyltransferase involved in cell wall biosynthesis
MTLVSVVVPAFNAEDTLSETLDSVRAQTHSDLEILIVDDGSTDSTPDVAQRFCSMDPRAKLIRKENGGVGSARNSGIEDARGEWIAPIDADDLWHPTKIERQLRRLDHCSPRVGLVYNWSRLVDERGATLTAPFAPIFEGCVFHEHLKWNFIGNASTPLIRREVLQGLCYSTEFAGAGAPGCEDYLLQLEIALEFEFACVPAFLTGYRVSAQTMSADVGRMIDSHILMFRLLLERSPPNERFNIERQLARYSAARGLVELRHGRIRSGGASLAAAIGRSWPDALGECVSRTKRWLGRFHRRISHPLVGRPFASLGPEEGGSIGCSS